MKTKTKKRKPGKVARRPRAKSRRGRHRFGEMRHEDGDVFQVCEQCGKTRFRGDRYTWPRAPCR